MEDKLEFDSFFTIAYNAEPYIAKTIESVLNQTETDLVYYIRDNGSTDGTLKIINHYMNSDSRIVVFHNEVNGCYETQEPFHFPKPRSKYLTILDADDYVVDDYAERMIEIAENHESDIVVAGTVFEDGNDGVFFAERRLVDYETADDGTLNFGDIASTYGQLRVFWGKLFKTDFFYENYTNWHKIDVGNIFNAYDTAVSLCLMLSANRVAFSNFVGHRQRIRNNSRFFSSSPEHTRAFELISIYKLGLMMLDKYNAASTENTKFIQSVARGHLLDLDRLLQKSNQSIQYKADFLEKIITNERFRELEKIIGYRAFVTQFETTIEELSDNLDSLLDTVKVFFLLYLQAQKTDISIAMRKLLLMKSIFSEDNMNRFGYDELYYWDSCEKIPKWFMQFGTLSLEDQKITVSNTKHLYDLISENYDVNDLAFYKNNILSLFDLGNIEDAKRINEYALEINPIDRELLYLRCIICKQLALDSDFRNAKHLIEIFYKHDTELLEEINAI